MANSIVPKYITEETVHNHASDYLVTQTKQEYTEAALLAIPFGQLPNDELLSANDAKTLVAPPKNSASMPNMTPAMKNEISQVQDKLKRFEGDFDISHMDSPIVAAILLAQQASVQDRRASAEMEALTTELKGEFAAAKSDDIKKQGNAFLIKGTLEGSIAAVTSTVHGIASARATSANTESITAGAEKGDLLKKAARNSAGATISQSIGNGASGIVSGTMSKEEKGAAAQLQTDEQSQTASETIREASKQKRDNASAQINELLRTMTNIIESNSSVATHAAGAMRS